MLQLNYPHKTDFKNGDPVDSTVINKITEDLNTIGEAINNGDIGGGSSIDTNGVISVSSKGNVTLNSNKNVNIEPAWSNNVLNYTGNYGDIALKPGDDIQFCSHHREPNKRDKIVIKNIDGSDNPVKCEVHAGEITLSTKNKALTYKKDKNTGEDTSDKMFKADDVMDINVITGNTLDSGTNNERDERGYLKVRAQAIDLRCEKHGGIALQPKGYDNEGNMNKIKFEHGGGDGLEFGTFNSEKTSIFTDEYRFNKDGVWKMSVRETVNSDKTIIDEGTIPSGKLPTGSKKYKKNNSTNNAAKSYTDMKTYEPADDFYDFIDTEDPQTTTKDIIKTSSALNNDFIETSLSSKKNLKISSISTYKIIDYEGTASGNESTFTINKNESYTKDQLKLILDENNNKLSDLIDTKLPFYINGDNGIYRLSGDITPKISLESEEEVNIDAKYGDVVITSGDTIKMEAPEIRLNAINSDKTGGTVNFGATQNIIFITDKLTKGLNLEHASEYTKVKKVILNNTSDTVYWDGERFHVLMKVIYADPEHTVRITPDNYSTYKELPAYFADGTKLPADYTCFIWTTYQNGNEYYTDVYKLSTKGSSAVLSKNIKGPVSRYIGDNLNNLLEFRQSLNTSDEITTMLFEFPTYTGENSEEYLNGIIAVLPEEFITESECDLGDIISLVSYMKSHNQGPWS